MKRKPRYKAEKEFAKLLNQQRKEWQYEPKRFKVDDSHYTPDFFLPQENRYYEIIGTRQAYYQTRFKIKRFREIYPHIQLIIIFLITDKAIKIPEDIYNQVVALAKKEERNYRTILKRAVENYLKAKKILKEK